MKKTLNINIGNSIIHIEEDAYEMLTSYLIEVKQHFGKSADDFEIVSDIENRIAEMFLEILQSQQKPVIELEDVQVVTGLMGSVEDFDNEQEEEPAAAYASPGAAPLIEKKLYRDTDEAMVAGVCSGLSHYLKIDVSVLRVIAVLTVFIGGSGLLAYLILWVTIPKARTRSEKMAMKGEAINLQGFKRNFEEELSMLRGNLQQAGDHLEPLVKRSGSFITEFGEVMGSFLQGAGKTIFKLIAVIIMIAASLMFLAAFVSLAAIFGFWDSSTSELFPFNIINEDYFKSFLFAVFITIIVPLLALILLSVRVAFNSRPVNRTLSYGLLLVWLAGLSVSIFFIAKISYEFKEEAEFTQSVQLKSFPVYQIDIDRSRFFSKEDSLKYQLNTADYEGKVIQRDHEHGDHPFTSPRNVSLRIEKSENSVPSLIESYRSEGVNFEIALSHAKNIQYDFKQADSVLSFSSAIHLKKNTNWRNQRVELVLRLPVGTRLKIDGEMDRYLQGFSLWTCSEANLNDDLYEVIMTDDGLKCRFED
jgi:phage shock protein PspC (stress-responsive transcriptional regulator)